MKKRTSILTRGAWRFFWAPFQNASFKDKWCYIIVLFFIARIREIPAAPEELRLGVSLSTQALQAGSESGDL